MPWDDAGRGQALICNTVFVHPNNKEAFPDINHLLQNRNTKLRQELTNSPIGHRS